MTHPSPSQLPQQGRRRNASDDARLRTTLEDAGIMTWDIDLVADAVNAVPAPVDADGRSFFRTVQQSFIALVHPDDRERVRRALDTALHSDAGILEVEYRRPPIPEGERWVLSKGRVTRDTEGLSTHLSGITIDVTDRHRLEDQLRQAQKMDALGQLAGGVAHDFNNLLTIIRMNGELLAESGPPDADLQLGLDEIMHAADRGAALARQLLAFSRRQPMQRERLQPAAVVRSVESMLRRLVGSQIELSTVITTNGWVEADAGQLEQVLLNLIVNARDAMPDGGRIRLRAFDVDVSDFRTDLESGEYVALEVRDEGVGVAAEHLDRIFEPFFTTKPLGEGTGLGLSTVHGIVTQFGGHLLVGSVPGAGATFTAFLPASPAPATSTHA